MTLTINRQTIPHIYRNRFLRDSNSNVIVNNSTSSSSGGGGSSWQFEPHYLWGQYFDDTQDISGDLTGVGNLSASGVITASGITLSDFVKAPTVSGTAASFNNGQFYTLSGTTIKGETISGGTIKGINISGDTIIGNTIKGDYISGNTGVINHLSSTTINVTNKITTNELSAFSAYIKTLLSEEITVDYLTVTKAAHFFKLIIDEIKATQGQIIITPTNAVIDKVETVNSNYRCYFRSKDEDREITNDFEVNDQVICQTFNVATGVSYNVSNTYYWRLCVATGTTSTTIDGETVDCHYIDLSDSDKDQYSISSPMAGDNIVQLGNRTDTNRQAAIIISAYNNQYLDPTIKAPSFVQYYGINDYSLASHRRNVISRDFNEFTGAFKTSNGDDIEQLIDDVTSGATAYLHTAWANSADGSVDFTKNPQGGIYSYIGFCTNHTEDDTSLVYSDYQWDYIKGQDGASGATGEDAEFYKLVPIVEKAIVDKDGCLGVQFIYNIAHVSGDAVTVVTASTNDHWIRFKPNNSDYYYNLSTGTTTPTYTDSAFIEDYHLQSDRPTYFNVYLVSGSNADVQDQKPINITFDAGATLEIADDIYMAVQGCNDDIDSISGTVSSHTNSIATLSLQYSAITSQVQADTIRINSLSGTVTSHTNDISQLKQTASSITLTVSSITEDLDAVSGTVTSQTASISQLQQTASSITATVSGLSDSVSQLQQTSSNLESTISSHTNSINSLSGDVSANTSSISQLQQTSSSLTSTVQQIEDTISQIDITKTVVVDATALDEGKAYPVVIDFKLDTTTQLIRCVVDRTLDATYGVPSYARHQSGFIINLDWNTKSSCWGVNQVNDYWTTGDTTRFITDYKIFWNTDDNQLMPIVGSIGQVRELSQEIVYVRGGSKYNIRTSYSNADITLYSTGYTWSRDGYSGTRPVINIGDLVIPRQDAMCKSEIIQTADNIQLNVYNELNEKTGIDVSAGTITLDADNTTIVGNLNLTDTNNGLTMYDNESVPRVNIQPAKIGNYEMGKYSWYTASKTETGHSNFYIELNTVSLGSISSGYDIAICYANINMWATNGISTDYPLSNPNIRAQIYCNGTQVHDFGYYGTTLSSLGVFYVNTPMIYTTKSAGTYTVKFTLSSTTTVDTSYSVYGMVNANIQWDLKAQTQIFTDGMLSQSAPNNYVKVKPDRVEMRQGTIGLRLISDNDNPSRNMFKGIQTIAGFRGSTPDVYPIWIPFHNFTPTFSCGDGKRKFTYQKLTNINQYKYAYQISPYNDYGIMIINSPAYDSSLNIQETWVMLPPLNSIGVNQLPIGYTITIINNTFGDIATNVYVVPSVSTQSTGMIIDSHRDTQYYSSINGTQSCDTYIYVGTWSNGTKNIMYWRSIHDTQ